MSLLVRDTHMHKDIKFIYKQMLGACTIDSSFDAGYRSDDEMMTPDNVTIGFCQHVVNILVRTSHNKI